MRRIVVLLAVVVMMVGMLGTSVAPAFAVSRASRSTELHQPQRAFRPRHKEMAGRYLEYVDRDERDDQLGRVVGTIGVPGRPCMLMGAGDHDSTSLLARVRQAVRLGLELNRYGPFV